MSEPDLLLSLAAAAGRVSLSQKALRRAALRGELRASKLCGRWRVRVSDLEAWIDAGVSSSMSLPVPMVPATRPPARGSMAALRSIEDELA